MSVAIVLVWPEKMLSPNSRAHWAAKAKAKAKARAAAFAIARVARSAGMGITADSTLKITFCPPDRRRRDLDNCLASIKAHLDGIADAFGVDDSGWRLRIERGAPVKCGCVRVEVS